MSHKMDEEWVWVCGLRAHAQREKGMGGVGCVEAYGMMYMLDLFIKKIKFERQKKVTEVEG